MKLKYIKINGFKSFAENTKIQIDKKIAAIVGPNGCGKSNIIDAIKWVLGDSSNKSLRSSNMTDVIFKGSSKLNMAGTASVTLVFNEMKEHKNKQYSQYEEIEISRKIYLDSTCEYYINKKKCRKKDIKDIFLGTGLGSLSYAIIEQGMISKLVESKPQELRIFVEEAAGISHYKERKRETEQKIKKTQENLSRVNDIKLEIEKQIETLAEQAENATRYKALYKEKRELEDLNNCNNWQKNEQKLQENRQKINKLNNEQKQLNDRIQHKEKELLTNSETIKKEAEAEKGYIILQAEQNTQISILEQNIALRQNKIAENKAKKQKSIEAEARLQSELKDLYQNKKNNQEQHDLISKNHIQQKNKLIKLEEEHQAQAEALTNIRLQQNQLITQERELQKASSLGKQAEIKIQNSIKETEQEKKRALLQLENNLESQAQTINQLNDKKKELIKKANHLESILKQEKEAQKLLKEQEELKATELNKAKEEQVITKGQLEVINLQIAKTNPQNQKLVADVIDYDKKWNKALEFILEPILSLPVTENFDLKTTSTQNNIKSAVNINPWVNNIKLTTTPSKKLADHELELLPNGDILGNGISIKHNQTTQGLLTYKDEKIKLTHKLEEITLNINNIKSDLENIRQQKIQIDSKAKSKEKQLMDYKIQHNQITLKHSQATKEEEKRLVTIAKATNVKIEASKKNNKLQQELTAIIDKNNINNEKLSSIVGKSADSQAEYQKINEQNKSYLSFLKQEQAIDKDLNGKLTKLNEQGRWIAKSIEDKENQIQKNEKRIRSIANELQIYQHDKVQTLELEKLKQEKHKTQTELNQTQKKIVTLNEQTNNLNNECKSHHKEQEEKKQKATNILIEIAKLEKSSENNLSNMHYPDEIPQYISIISKHKTKNFKQQIEANRLAINQLGSINLSSIDQHAESLNRHKELTDQTNDIEKALETLQEAIKIIDKKTTYKFKQTLINLNREFNETFNVIFNGGTSSLLLTENDFLTGGLEIKAQPTGKKNTSISMLSGGEKALTALALIFGAFKLNPAPFCLLDEVDAPLDDKNTHRFCALIKKLSDKVQFIFISHNKITATIADTLIGVTMQESGVSKIASVDIATAIKANKE